MLYWQIKLLYPLKVIICAFLLHCIYHNTKLHNIILIILPVCKHKSLVHYRYMEMQVTLLTLTAAIQTREVVQLVISQGSVVQLILLEDAVVYSVLTTNLVLFAHLTYTVKIVPNQYQL